MRKEEASTHGRRNEEHREGAGKEKGNQRGGEGEEGERGVATILMNFFRNLTKL